MVPFRALRRVVLAGLVAAAAISCGGAERTVDDPAGELESGWQIRADGAPSAQQVPPVAGPWREIESTLRVPRHGASWLRRTLEVPPELRGREAAYFLDLQGSAQLYVDGALVADLGRLPVLVAHPGEVSRGRLGSLRLPARETAELAILYREGHRSFNWQLPSSGFRLRVGSQEQMAEAAHRRTRLYSAHQWALVGAFSGQAILHLLLFGFYPRIRSNFWFGLTTLSSSVLAGLHFERCLSEDPRVLALAAVLWGVELMLTMGLLLTFAYEVFDQPRRWLFWGLLAVGALLLLVAAVHPELEPFTDFWWWHLAVLLETLRVTVRKMRAGWGGAALIAAGLGALTLGLTWQMVIVTGQRETPFEPFPIAYYGVAGMLLCVSVYLAYHFARLGRRLRQRLEEVEALSEKTLEQELARKELETQRLLLEADNRRKTEELEEARRLQISLLPAALPSVPGIEVAAWMETATEVGGDFYDFMECGPGLVVAIGDAAGHGARAGAMVSLVKGMLSSLREDEAVPRWLEEASERMRATRLPGLQVALALGRVVDGRLGLCSAGMPPALIYRAVDGSVEELLVEGMPLGGIAGFRYRGAEIDLLPGDTVLFSSDGLPEAVGDDGTVFGYDRLAAALREVGARGAREVVDAMVGRARSWSGGRGLQDDVTFVVLKIAASGAAPAGFPH